MTGITYDGVPSAEGGKIFKNVNFWVAQRVPQRPRWVELIKINGGSVVPLERQADMLIADHARKNVPAGCYSWKFIEDSVKHGMAQVKDKYLIGRDPDIPRPAASGNLARGKRIPFTAADDAILVKWVMAQASRETSKVKLFQEFEQINSRHTWQSWLDRWNKRLSLLSSQQLEAMAATAPASTNGTPPSRAPRSPSPRSPSPPPPSPPRSAQVSKPKPSPKQQKPPSRRNQLPDTIQETPQDEIVEEESEDLFCSSPTSVTSSVMVEQKEKQFLLDLKIYANASGAELNFAPTVEGQPVSLFQIVTLLDGATDDIDWEAITQDLGFNASRRNIVRAIRQIWIDNLEDFLAQMDSFEDGSEHEDSESDDSESEPSKDLEVPPVTNNKKRFQNDDEPAARPLKREKLDPYEVPSTPDYQLHPKRQPPVSGSPSLGARTPDRQVNRNRRSGQRTVDNPQTPISKQPQLLSHESTYDVTPSQQLDLEAQQTGSPFIVGRRTQQTHTSPVGDGSPRGGHSSHQATARPPIHRPNTLTTTPKPQPRPAKRRTLPASFASRDPPETQAQPPSSTPRKRPVPMSMTGNDRNDSGNVTPRVTNTHISEPITIEGWVEHYQSLGYTHAIVVQAMTATTMTPGCLTAHALESLSAGNGIPRNIEGIWTSRDDKSLRELMSLGDRIENEPTDAGEHQILQRALRERRRLLNKHGQLRMDLREEFLRASDALPKGPGQRR